jgi:uncharacterized protein CbrC (UPF0167 family)
MRGESEKTFADLGIPFPLFSAPISEANDYVGAALCSICLLKQPHCFLLGIGTDLMVNCPNCQTQNGLDADDRVGGSCRVCVANLAFPDVPEAKLHSCYECLRAGRVALTKETELGMVTWQNAFQGITHGVPGLNNPDFTLVPVEDDWIAARVAPEYLFELLRTPSYPSWQGEIWLFHCGRPMAFLGTWERSEFSRRSPDGDGKSYFEKIVEKNISELWEDRLHDTTSAYVFECTQCGRLRGNWDSA